MVFPLNIGYNHHRSMLHSHSKVIALLLAIFFLASAIRMFSLDSIPYAAHTDEASWGYNAYSILRTGMDEFGKKTPLIFTAYGDQKLPVYTYAIVPFIKIFGLSNMAVRMPAALAGSILCIFIYLFLRGMQFGKSESLLGALITATSPWLLMLSRVFGLDSGLGLLFFVIGLWLAMKSLKNDRLWFLIGAAVSFGLTWYCYIAYRVVSTGIIFLYIIIYCRTKALFIRKGLLLIAAYVLVTAPLIVLSFSGQGTSRFSQVLFTSSSGMVMAIDEDRGLCAKSLPKIICYLNSNKITSYTSSFMGRYISALSLPYLFFEGDTKLQFMNIDGYGLMHLVSLPLYLFGLVSYVQKIATKQLTKGELFILLGLLLSPLPAIVVGDVQKVRISGMYPFMVVTCLYGLQYMTQYLKGAHMRRVATLVISTILILNTVFFMVAFLNIHVKKHEISFHNHVAKLMQYLGKQDKDIHIYIKTIDEAIVLYAYYNVAEPELFQNHVVRPSKDAIGFSHATDFQNIHRTDKNFDQIYCATHAQNTHALYATNENLALLGVAKKPKKVIYSEGMVHELLFEYDTRDIFAQKVDCKYLMGRDK